MDSIFDPTLILFALAVVLAGQLFVWVINRRRRATAAVIDRNLYFSRITESCMEMTERAEELERENKKMANELKELGLDIDFDNYDSNAVALEQSLRTKRVRVKQERLQLIQAEVDELKIALGLEYYDDQLLLERLEPQIKQLEDELEDLKSQSESISQPASPSRIDEMDPNLMNYIEKHMKDTNFTPSYLKKVYETLLKIKAYSPNQSLDDYLARIKSKPNYEAEFIKLDQKRIRVENQLAAKKEMYQVELDSFNETRIEYLFKNTGAQKLLNDLRAKNSIAEKILENRRKDIEKKDRDISNGEYQDL